MDPFSITVGTVGLVTFCGQIVKTLSQIVDNAKTVDSTVKTFSEEIKGLAHVLNSISTVLQEPNVSLHLASTGIEGQHWRDVQKCLTDCRLTLVRLDAILVGLKSSDNGLLSRARTQFQLSIKSGEIALLRRQLVSFKQTMQISLQMIVLSSQTSESGARNSLIPRLDNLTTEIRDMLDTLRNMLQEGYRFLDPRTIPGSSGASQVSFQRITGLPDVTDPTSSEYPRRVLVHDANTLDSGPSPVWSTVMTQTPLSRSADETPETILPETLTYDHTVMSNLQDCVLSAGKMVSSASTLLTRSTDPGEPYFGSDFGDPLAADRRNSIEGWIPAASSNITTSEFRGESDNQRTTISLLCSEESNKEHPDLETELIHSLYGMGRKYFEAAEYCNAEQFIKRLLTLQGAKQDLEGRDDAIDILVTSYCKQKKWKEAELCLIEHLSDRPADDDRALTWLHMLAEISLRIGSLDSAENACQRAMKRRKGLLGASHPQFLQSVELLIAIYQRKQDYIVAECYRAAFLPSGITRGGIFWEEAVQALNENGFDLERLEQNDVVNAMRWASEKGLDKVLLVLMETKGGIKEIVNLKDRIGKTALHYASAYGHATTTGLLLENGADPKIQAACTMTALHLAAHYGEVAVVRELLDHSAVVDSLTHDGKTPLHTATEQNRTEVMKLLLTRNANIEAANYKQRTPLHQACSRGCVEAIKVLLLHRVNINARDYQGYSPLHFAASGGHTTAVQLLLEHGADVEARALTGSTPIFAASGYGHYDTIQKLLDHGASVNAVDRLGVTPLHRAAKGGHQRVVQLLGLWGAKPHVGVQR